MSKKLGGAHNTSAFRKIVERGFIPDKKAITFEGLFHQYFFNFGGVNEQVKNILEPLYSVAQVPNWITGEVDRYIGLSLVSSEDGKDYREPMNCIVVLDISGSMGSFFDVDYNDGPIYQEIEGKFVTTKKTKMEIANECLLELSRNMKDDENFGVILFDEKTEILQPLRRVGLIDREKLEEDISNIQPRGGTNMEIGMRTAIEMLQDYMKENEGKEEGSCPTNHRIIFLTDAQPNSGGGSETLTSLSREAATVHKIFTTFIGIGLDFNSSLVDDLAKIMGSNYFSVHSRKEFKKILNEDFNYMVTPIAHNCNLFFESEAFEVEKCFGTPHEHSGILMSIQTVSAGPRDVKRGIKGGIVLIKLKEKLRPPQQQQVSKVEGVLTLEYITADQNFEKKHFDARIALGEKFEVMEKENKYFENSGIRKAVLLVTFCQFMHSTIDQVENKKKKKNQIMDDNNNIKNSLPNKNRDLGSEEIEQLKNFKRYFLKEMEEIGDKSLGKELDIVDRMIYRK